MPSDVAPDPAPADPTTPAEHEVRAQVEEHDHGLVVEVPLPWDGAYSDLRVDCTAGGLTVHGRRHHGSSAVPGRPGISSFSTDIPVAERFELRGVKAAFGDGILRLTVPRRDATPADAERGRPPPTELPGAHVDEHPDDA